MPGVSVMGRELALGGGRGWVYGGGGSGGGTPAEGVYGEADRWMGGWAGTGNTVFGTGGESPK